MLIIYHKCIQRSRESRSFSGKWSTLSATQHRGDDYHGLVQSMRGFLFCFVLLQEKYSLLLSRWHRKATYRVSRGCKLSVIILATNQPVTQPEAFFKSPKSVASRDTHFHLSSHFPVYEIFIRNFSIYLTPPPPGWQIAVNKNFSQFLTFTLSFKPSDRVWIKPSSLYSNLVNASMISFTQHTWWAALCRTFSMCCRSPAHTAQEGLIWQQVAALCDHDTRILIDENQVSSSGVLTCLPHLAHCRSVARRCPRPVLPCSPSFFNSEARNKGMFLAVTFFAGNFASFYLKPLGVSLYIKSP